MHGGQPMTRKMQEPLMELSDRTCLRMTQASESLHKRPLRSSMAAGTCGLLGLLLVQGALAGSLEAINHTHWAINRFSVEGRSGVDIIGPYQRGGEAVVTSPLHVGSRE